jgi:hypothetical protein
VRHFRLSAIALLAILTLALSGSAMADSVTMQFTGTGGNSSGGVATYPYLFSIDGGSSTALICDTYDNEVVVGETWQATVSGLLSGNGLFGNQTLNYKAAGLIFQGIVAGTINPNAGNWAIWGLFSANALSNPAYVSSGAAAIASQYLALAQNAPNSAFDNILLFTPIPGTQSWKRSLPQEYIGIKVPEPGEVAMLGMLSLMVLGAFAFRKQLGIKPAAR